VDGRQRYIRHGFERSAASSMALGIMTQQEKRIRANSEVMMICLRVLRNERTDWEELHGDMIAEGVI
jgi:hypothetical protein